jgi:AcrR family transcriptional regulator
MSRAEATQARILAAATEEFAAYGIAGARVDRIAKAAGANKNLIYVYFTSKDRLFDAVFDAHVVRVMDEVPFTAEELPEYAGRLFDFYLDHPELPRLATWYRLERAGDEPVMEVIAGSYRAKLAAISKAQRAKKLDRTFAPPVLLSLVLAIAATWGSASTSVIPGQGLIELGERTCREAVVAATRRLLDGAKR